MIKTGLVFIFLLTSFLSPFSRSKEGSPFLLRLQSEDGCEEPLERIVNGELPFEQLANPILTTEAELAEQVDLYATLYQCLDEEAASQIDGGERFRRYLEYFLIFTAGLGTEPEETTLDLVLLDTSTDPGVAKIRDEAGIEAPEGYVFVRLYDSREAMPAPVGRAFQSPEVAGVTILSRYIAILAEEKNTWAQRALQQRTLPETTSHELIHAYVNSIISPLEIDLPAWYSEGLAIYFSGSEIVHTIITPNFSIRSTSSAEYQDYNIIFKYLEAELGREELLERIAQSIQAADPSRLYQDLGISSDQELASQARAWSQARNNLGRGGIVAAAFLVVLLLWRFAPEYNCQNCGHSGRKRDLIDEVYCPNCKRPYDREVPY
jgi:hypothetical protein